MQKAPPRRGFLFLEADAQLGREAPLSSRRHLDRTVAVAAPDPAELEKPVRQRSAERAGHVELPLTAVEAAANSGPPKTFERREIDPELLEARRGSRPEGVVAVAPHEHAFPLERLRERHTDLPSEMVVARPCIAQQLAAGRLAQRTDRRLRRNERERLDRGC